MRRLIICISINFLFATKGFCTLLYWVGTNGNYNDPGNWNTQPNGSGISSAPFLSDDLIIDRNAIIYIDGYQQISSLWIINRANVVFINTRTSANFVIGIYANNNNSIQPQFKIDPGATLSIQGNRELNLAMATYCIAHIYGTIDITAYNSKIIYPNSPGKTYVMKGGKIRYGPGSGDSNGSLTGLHMLDGSIYEIYKDKGVFPQGTFDKGSILLNTGAITLPAKFTMPSTVGAYGNYQFNSPAYVNTSGGINQNVTFHHFILSNTGTGKWLVNSNQVSDYTITITGQLLIEAGAKLDLNNNTQNNTSTKVRISGDFYCYGQITETGVSTNSLVELNGNEKALVKIVPDAISNDVSLMMNRSADIFAGDIYLPNSPNAKLYLINGNINVQRNRASVFIQNPKPDAISGGSVNSHIIGKLIRNSNSRNSPYLFPVSDQASQLAKASIVPYNNNETTWNVEFISPNPLRSLGLTPGLIDMVSPYYWSIINSGSSTPSPASNIELYYSDLNSSTIQNPSQVKIIAWNNGTWQNLGGSITGGSVINTMGSNGLPAQIDSITNFDLEGKFAFGGISGTFLRPIQNNPTLISGTRQQFEKQSNNNDHHDLKRKIHLISIFPNPANAGQESQISLSSTTAGNVTIVITDMHGRRLSVKNHSIIAGNNQLKLDTGQLPAGQYQVQILTENGKSVSRQLIRL